MSHVKRAFIFTTDILWPTSAKGKRLNHTRHSKIGCQGLPAMNNVSADVPRSTGADVSWSSFTLPPPFPDIVSAEVLQSGRPAHRPCLINEQMSELLLAIHHACNRSAPKRRKTAC